MSDPTKLRQSFWGILKVDIEIFRNTGRGTISADAVEACLKELAEAKRFLRALPPDNQTPELKEWLDSHDEINGYKDTN